MIPMSRYYITTAIPYVNAKPHLGHVLEFIETDVLVRWLRQNGGEVRFSNLAVMKISLKMF